MKQGIRIGGVFQFVKRTAAGTIVDAWQTHNLVTTEGLVALLQDYFQGSSQTVMHIALLGTTPSIIASTTAGSITEITSYSGNRQAFVSVVSAGTCTNSASTVTYTFTTAAAIGGAALIGPSTGTAVLFCGAAGSEKSLADTETLEVTYSVTAADDGA